MTFTFVKTLRRLAGVAALLVAFAASISTNKAQAVQGIDAIRIAGDFDLPVFAAAPPGDGARLFVVEQSGRIFIIDLASRTVKPTPFLDLSDVVTLAGEEGLLGLAFDPNYAANGRFYVNYVTPGGAFSMGVTHIALFRVSSNPDIANRASERTLLTYDQPQSNHNAGWIGFSPRPGDEGNLYISSGDGGASNDQGPGHIEPGGNAQNLTTLLGKMLRIHINDSPTGSYSIPADNPFIGVPGAREEIWAYGLRNPFRNSFDRLTGTMFIGDVGQSEREEIDAQSATQPGGGENYSWRVREGFIQNPAFPSDPVPPDSVDPAYDYPHSVGQTVIGGYVYRGKKIRDLRGVYVFADFLGPNTGDFTGRIFTLNFNGIVASNFQDITAELFPTRIGNFPLVNPASLGEDGRGELYICDIGSGNVFQIVRGR
ncbi:MAG: PQQ-dependent sugar dehydrogenase [Verrucomicrobiota bacterium]|nr:PQQ-dependent sugar dehydrogenase [Verrucomicrobiota bacterium]